MQLQETAISESRKEECAEKKSIASRCKSLLVFTKSVWMSATGQSPVCAPVPTPADADSTGQALSLLSRIGSLRPRVRTSGLQSDDAGSNPAGAATTGIDVNGSISVLQTERAGSNPVYPSKSFEIKRRLPSGSIPSPHARSRDDGQTGGLPCFCAPAAETVYKSSGNVVYWKQQPAQRGNVSE